MFRASSQKRTLNRDFDAHWTPISVTFDRGQFGNWASQIPPRCLTLLMRHTTPRVALFGAGTSVLALFGVDRRDLGDEELHD